jgi:RNA polymerase sigma factor (sigma-70 family)
VTQEDHRNFEKSWAGIEKRLGVLFYRRGCPPEDIKDLLQETVRRAWEHRNNLKGNFDPWAYGIARNVLREYLDKINHSVFRGDSPDTYIQHDEPDEQTLIRVMVQQSLQELDEIGRKCVTLHYLEGHSFEKIAEILGISLSNAHYHVDKACKELRKRFAGNLRQRKDMVL